MAGKPISSLPFSPSFISAITQAGYNTVGELADSNAETLAREINTSLSESQSILDKAVSSSTTTSFSFGQTAAAYISSAKTYSSSCQPLDALLNGGLPRAHVLELSGPPGTCKERLALRLACNAVNSNEGILWVEMQNFMSPAALKQAILDSCPSIPNAVNLVQYLSIHSLPELLIFLNNLLSSMEDYSSVSVIVFNSIWFPFQTATDLTATTRRSLLDSAKQTFTRLCAAHNITVRHRLLPGKLLLTALPQILTTTQLSTKILNRDGTSANFDTGSRAVLVPHLGGLYLPSSRTYRIIIVPETRTTGVLRLMLSPHGASDGQPAPEQRYELISGEMQGVVD
ncbi:hypothetical protein EVG20_g5335 [Dentipellis fragilis]|uniref:DNA recombination and repair protein Rad51-like C-terminal domain-containing protein n=1 Tax=Dentipellis fragilis TaxID=205917 RepID=A0A4Y9YUA6_9AGAM|nr:hypothetical protein EVG20_g5335 [Dentipellis fragilis]